MRNILKVTHQKAAPMWLAYTICFGPAVCSINNITRTSSTGGFYRERMMRKVNWWRSAGTGLCSYRVRGVDGSSAKHLTAESHAIVMLLTFILINY